ncbi:MAG: ATP-binding protein [Nitrososphaerota archaeon]|nr:ATP-binding protein [Nitrososphaerota archaeon]
MSREGDFRYVMQNFDIANLPKILPRDIKIPLNLNLIITVTGPRRAGKTYVMFGIMNQLMAQIPQKNILYINFESERLRNLDANDLESALKVFYELNNPSEPIYIFLDEIQNVKDWERWARSIFDRGNFRIYITGSSSKLSSKDIATALRGRSIEYTVFPLSFAEFLKFNDFQIDSVDALTYSDRRGVITGKLMEYLEYGSYPEVCLQHEVDIKYRVLTSYYQAILYRDIGERSGAKQAIVNEVVLYLVSNYAKYISVSKIYNHLKGLGYRVSKQTIIDIINTANEAFFLFFAEIFSKSIKNRRQYPRKVYLVDTGIIKPAAVDSGIGRSMENAVMVELLRRSAGEVYYWREYGKAMGDEVDFVIKRGVKVYQLIQVTYASDKNEIRDREKNALTRAGMELGCSNLLIITWDYEGIIDNRIRCVPLWKWLLNTSDIQG